MIIIENEQCKLERILYEIDYIYHTTGHAPRYSVMNRDTYRFIVANIKDNYCCYRTIENGTKIYDTDIAFCDSLKFGEVDVV